MAGDSVDNVPGVPGIGVKTGAQLITEYGDLETLLTRAPEIKQQKRRENLIQFAEQARLSKRLVTLDDRVAVEEPLASFAIDAPKASAIIGFLKALEFTTLTRRVAADIGADIAAIDPIPVEVKFWPPEGVEIAVAPKVSMPAAAADAVPAVLAPRDDSALLAVPFVHGEYETVMSLEALDTWIAAAREQGYVAFDTETNSLDAMQCTLAGVSLATAPGRACYIPLAHRGQGSGLFGGETVEGQIPRAAAIARLKDLFEDPSILKIGQNAKYDLQTLGRCGIDVTPIDDTMLISYALESGENGHGMDELSEKHLGHKPIAFKEVAGSGKSQITFDQVPLDRATAYAAEDADVTLRLWLLLKPRLVSKHKMTVYETLERPMVPVLRDMEKRGVLVDRAVLGQAFG